MSLNQKFFYLLLLLTGTLIIYTGCKEDDEPTNSAPTCIIISPEDSDEFAQGENVIITVDALDEDDNLQKVTVYINGIELGSVSSFPFDFEWNTSDVDPGTFTIKAEAIDETQAQGSDEINIIIDERIADIDDNVYNTVQIGNQIWMAENLKTTTYNDGTSIELVTDYDEWVNKTTGAYCWYNNDEATYADTYGALYNWYAVETGNLCPDGWHVPTDDEWKTLEMYLGMSQAEADTSGLRGTNEGSKLAGNAALWTDGNLDNDSEFGSSGFTALPGGDQITNAGFQGIGIGGVWWSATESNIIAAFIRVIMYDTTGIRRGNNGRKEQGFSVRCVKDN